MARWIKLYDKAVDSACFQNASVWKVWCFLLMTSNWKDGNYRGFELSAGDNPHSIRYIAIGCKLPKTTVERCLKSLEKWSQISFKTGQQGRVISICNWSTYQNSVDDAGTRVGREWDTNGTRVGHEWDESKNTKREEEGVEGQSSKKDARAPQPDGLEISASEHVGTLMLPVAIQGSERCRKQLIDWQAVRFKKHGSFTDVVKWDALKMTWAHFSETQWFTSLLLSTRVESADLCNGDNDHQKRGQNGRPAKNYKIPKLSEEPE